MSKVRSLREPEVAIVSSNTETLDGLQSYLRGAGVSASTIRSIDDIERRTSCSIDACVMFPDDFRWESVVAAIADLMQRNRATLPVLVTAYPKRFEELAFGERVLVITRPVWGWKILDAIRAYVDTEKRAPLEKKPFVPRPTNRTR